MTKISSNHRASWQRWSESARMTFPGFKNLPQDSQLRRLKSPRSSQRYLQWFCTVGLVWSPMVLYSWFFSPLCENTCSRKAGRRPQVSEAHFWTWIWRAGEDPGYNCSMSISCWLLILINAEDHDHIMLMLILINADALSSFWLIAIIWLFLSSQHSEELSSLFLDFGARGKYL